MYFLNLPCIFDFNRSHYNCLLAGQINLLIFADDIYVTVEMACYTYTSYIVYTFFNHHSLNYISYGAGMKTWKYAVSLCSLRLHTHIEMLHLLCVCFFSCARRTLFNTLEMITSHPWLFYMDFDAFYTASHPVASKIDWSWVVLHIKILNIFLSILN